MAVLGDTSVISLKVVDKVLSNLNPQTTSVYDLGTSSLKWNNVYANKFYGSGAELTGIPLSAFTGVAQGDLLYGSEANKVSSLTIGTQGQILKSMNGVPSWQPFLGTYYGTCSTGASTKAKVVVLTNGDGFSLTAGTTVAVKFTNASAAATMTLTFQDSNGNSVSEAKQLYQYGSTKMGNDTQVDGWAAGAIVLFIYDGTYWFRQYWYNSPYYSAYTDTKASTAAKVGKGIANYSIQQGHFAFYNVISNSAASALTLNICGEGALPIWLNGQASSATNYTFPAGYYIGYCDGTNYYFNTDGNLPGVGINLFTKGTLLASGTNIDTEITTPGTYYSTDSTRTQTLHGQLPCWGSGFKLIHATSYSSNNYIKQFVMDSSFSLAYRHLSQSNGVWTYGVWKTLAHIDSTIDSTTGAAVWSAVGSTTQPVYVTRYGVITAGNTYAGGTCVTLNGTSKASSTITIYAPTTAGTSGQFLKSNGSGAPEWSAVPGIEIVRW